MPPCMKYEYPAQTSGKKGEEREEETARKAVLNISCTANSTSCDGSYATGGEEVKRKESKEKEG